MLPKVIAHRIIKPTSNVEAITTYKTEYQIKNKQFAREQAIAAPGPPLSFHTAEAMKRDATPPAPTAIPACVNNKVGERNDGILRMHNYKGPSCSRGGVLASACRIRVTLGKKYVKSPMQWTDTKKRDLCLAASKKIIGRWFARITRAMMTKSRECSKARELESRRSRNLLAG